MDCTQPAASNPMEPARLRDSFSPQKHRSIVCHALQGHCLPRTAGTQRHCTNLPALQKQEHQKRGRGSACPAGMQGCHPPSTAGTWGTARIQSYLPSVTAGTQGTATAGTEQHCPPCTAGTAALPAWRCEIRRHHPSSTAGMQEPRASSILHCMRGTAIRLCPSQNESHCPPLR